MNVASCPCALTGCDQRVVSFGFIISKTNPADSWSFWSFDIFVLRVTWVINFPFSYQIFTAVLCLIFLFVIEMLAYSWLDLNASNVFNFSLSNVERVPPL
jgi:hypothetical protein